jgi:aminocarboxymuconate-semialdehyde decarboxylase
MRTIDIHDHCIPAGLIDAARRGEHPAGLTVVADGGADWLVHPEGYRYPITPTFFDPAARLAEMATHGIDAALVSTSPTIFLYDLTGDAAIHHARETNDAIADHVAGAPDRLAGLATLPMAQPEAAARELERAVGDLGLRGAAIGPVVGSVPLDDGRCDPVLAAAEALGVPLLLHPYYVGPRPGLPDFYLTNLVGNPLETTISAARLILSGALDRFPRLRLTLVHGGGYLPYQIGRLDHGWEVRPESKGSALRPSDYLPRFVFDTITHDPTALGFLVDLVGADRVAYGTDLPFDMMDGSLDAQLGSLDLTVDQRRAISSGTAEQWFGPIGTTTEPPSATIATAIGGPT